MANKKKKQFKKLPEVILGMTPAEADEALRFNIELKALSERFFIPVDFELIEKDLRLFSTLAAEHFKRKNEEQKDVSNMSYAEVKKLFAKFDSDLKKQYRFGYDKAEKFDANDSRIKVEVNYNYIAHNYEVLEIIKSNEKNNGTKVFKYVSYQQMADIFFNGFLKKEELEFKPILSNEGYLNPLEFDAMAEMASEFREAGLKMAGQKSLLEIV